MKTTEIQYEQTLWVCLGVLVLLTLGLWLLAGCEGSGGKVLTAADCIKADQQHDAEIRAEANAPGPSPEAERQILAAMARRKAQEEHQLAEYAKFQFEQRLELAEASAPRIIPGAQGNAAGPALGQVNPGRRDETIALSGHASRHGGAKPVSDAVSASDRLYVREVLENSANQLSADSADREREGNANANASASGDQGAPFGNPVPGKPGYVTSPAPPLGGYIDVRGYSPGTQVVDPYTGQPMRVP
jgi:hypothetical protein